jgi:alkylation response protein AidB-like acyl-CoA dehydrogenase
MIKEVTKQWSNDVLLPRVREMDNASKLSSDVIEQLFDNGYMGLEVPPEDGGSGLSFTAACLVIEEISKIDPSVAILVDIHNTLTINAIRFWGSPTVQQYWLPRLASNTISSFCLSEPNSGSDAFSLSTTATPSSADQSYYRINGNKLWISNAKEAGVFLVFANVAPEKGYKGITAFLVPAESEGITVGPPEKKLGLKASSTCPVHFDNVEVSSDNILGEVGMGYKYCIQILNEGRIGIAAQQIGIAKGCFDIVMPYLLERKQFGQPIASFQVRTSDVCDL